ncbi:MAG: NAD(P)H-dependent oxidoreductase [Candidatus Puniceispirillum sp.]
MNILRLDSSMRHSGSDSRALADSLVAKLQEKLGSSTLACRDLKAAMGPVSGAWRDASLNNAETRSSQDRAVLAQSDALSAELDRADILVVAMPIYNFSVPTSFRAWVDLVCRDNVDGASATTLDKRAHNKRAVVVLTSNHTTAGAGDDFATGYATFILRFLGATTVDIVDATGLAGDRDAVLARARATIDRLANQLSDEIEPFAAK